MNETSPFIVVRTLDYSFRINEEKKYKSGARKHQLNTHIPFNERDRKRKEFNLRPATYLTIYHLPSERSEHL
jgi:hypothetical protein